MNENPTNAEEQCELGDKYYYGNGVPEDKEKAMYWYKKAADQGHAKSQYYLGDYLSIHKKEFKEAIYWYTKSAEQDPGVYDGSAMYNLGVIYSNGDGLPGRDLIKAKYWLSKIDKQSSYYSLAKDILDKIEKVNTYSSLYGGSSENSTTIYSVIGALLLGIILAGAGFLGFIIGAVAGWFIGKKIGQKIKGE